VTPAATAPATVAAWRPQLAEVGRSSRSWASRQRHPPFDPGSFAVRAGRPGIAPEKQFEVLAALEAGVFVDGHALNLESRRSSGE
jgi:hypothetical protein